MALGMSYEDVKTICTPYNKNEPMAHVEGPKVYTCKKWINQNARKTALWRHGALLVKTTRAVKTVHTTRPPRPLSISEFDYGWWWRWYKIIKIRYERTRLSLWIICFVIIYVFNCVVCQTISSNPLFEASDRGRTSSTAFQKAFLIIWFQYS